MRQPQVPRPEPVQLPQHLKARVDHVTALDA